MTNINPNNLTHTEIFSRVNELAFKVTYILDKPMYDDLYYDFRAYFLNRNDALGLFIIAQLEAIINGTGLSQETLEAYWGALSASHAYA